MNLVYDVAHNIAKIEKHVISDKRQVIRDVLVHRKGATRAFPDQPVIIGGSMETGSYLLVGTEGAMKKTFGSTAHGSGRTMSRTQAKKMVQGKALQEKMKKRGIYVKSASYSGLAEEAGVAYKDINEVVAAVSEADISQPVAKLMPLGNIKG
jgi:tRNA-splicing ligase RtcB